MYKYFNAFYPPTWNFIRIYPAVQNVNIFYFTVQNAKNYHSVQNIYHSTI